MVTVEEATGIIFSNLFPKKVVTASLEETVGRTLAEPVHADRSFPPFNRVAMDGIAIRFASYSDGVREFLVERVQPAGNPPTQLANPLHCIEVMTGAVLPNGTDTVIRYEDIHIENRNARITVPSVSEGQNIHTEGADARAGQLLLEPGTFISPAEVALLAAVGKAHVKIYDYPKTAVISGGDELIDISASPQLFEIRRSNIYAIESAMRQMHWPCTKFHFPDNRDVLLSEMNDIASKYDVMILSGGVSKGKFDFIPAVLEAIGIEKKFHQVSQRPGKPFWFGVSASGKIVFALPGNPVSTYMCFYRYIKPWILKSFGIQEDPRNVILGTDVNTSLPVTYFLQVKVREEQGKLLAFPLAGGGSGDFANLKDVTGFLQLPPSATGHKAGDVFPYIPFRE